MNIQHPMPVNFRFIIEKTRAAPGLYKKIKSAFYADNDLQLISFYKPILFIA